jgi:dihydroorotate dehydrogenase (NAD+) catalytic subunit
MSVLGTEVAGLRLANPVMTASGTAGFGTELGVAMDLARLGAHVCKSIALAPHEGNPPPRLAPLPVGMLNSVGLPGPGVEGWLARYYPGLVASRSTFGVSIWGRTGGEYVEVARRLAEAAQAAAFLELNLSCPNLEAGRELFAHDPAMVQRVTAGVRQVWAGPLTVKLSANTDRLLDAADAALAGGASGLVAINTVFGAWIAPTGPVLGTPRGGGLSGRAIHPIALRAVSDLRAHLPGVSIIGVGGVATAGGVLRMLAAGANAVQVGTATFADPRRPQLVVEELERLVVAEGVASLAELVASYRTLLGQGRTT